MDAFKTLTIDDKDILMPYLSLSTSGFCDYTFSNIYMWRNELSTAYKIVNETLIVRKEYEKHKYAYLFPLGKDIKGSIEYLKQYALDHHETLEFYALSDDNLIELQKFFSFTKTTTNPDWSDYLYNANDLLNYPGKRYEGKRHNANKFHRLYSAATFKKATKEDLPRLLSFLKDYQRDNAGKDISPLELSLNEEMLPIYEKLGDKVGYYELEGKIIGFAYGEKVNDIIYSHIEKALRDYEGIYQALTQDYLRVFSEGALYENREEDDGNPGLKEAKEQLHPVKMLTKSFLTITNNVDLLSSVEPLSSKRLSLSLIKEEYLKDYQAMALDPELNKYWGYDLPKDIDPSTTYFYNDITNDYKSHQCLSYSLLLDNRFIGEAVLYNFTDDNTGELGIRLLKEYQGQGLAKEACLCLIGYAFNKLNLKGLRYESYKANEPSLKLATALGFTKINENEERYFYYLTNTL